MVAAIKSSEIEAHMAFDVIRYSQVWEDSQRLCAALAIDDQDTVLSVSSSGCNALALLLRQPRQVIACDLNPTQNAVLALKKAAMPVLGHEEFLQLIGFLPSIQRRQLYEKVEVPPPYGTFWKINPDILEAGLILEGRLDRFFREFARDHFVRMPGAAEFKQSFYRENAPVPAAFIAAVKDPKFAATFIQAFGQTLAQRGRDPAQYRYVTEENIGSVFYERLVKDLSSRVFYGNHYMHFFYFGEPIVAALGPDYVRPGNYAKLRTLVDRIEIRTQTIESIADPFTKANLSNIFEYMSAENMEALLRTLSDRMPRGGRVAYWNLLVDRPLPDALRDRFRTLNPTLPRDQIWFYKAFHVLERL